MRQSKYITKYEDGGEQVQDQNPINNIVYNPDWFQPQQESQFNEFVDAFTQAQQPAQEEQTYIQEPTEQEDKYENLFESMQSMLQQLQEAKQANQQIQNQDDDEDVANFEALFNEDNTPVNWDDYGQYKKAVSNAKSQTYSPSQSAQTSYAFFLSKGLSPAQAAGIVGNLSIESGNFDPNVISGKRRGDGGKATGIAQWHPDRFQNVTKVANNLGLNPLSLEGQLEGIWWELNNTEKAALQKLKYATDPQQAAALVDKHYERSAGLHTKQRQNIASQIYNSQNG